jgi:hypothetical protein
VKLTTAEHDEAFHAGMESAYGNLAAIQAADALDLAETEYGEIMRNKARLQAQADALVEKEERLKALLPYVQHKPNCDALRLFQSPDSTATGMPAPRPCSCGLAALQSLPEEET